MAEKAVSLSDRIGVMATAKTIMTLSVNLIQEKAAEAKNQVSIHHTLSSEAVDFFLKGDMQTHDRIVKESAQDLKSKVGVIVLAQASMGHIADSIRDITGVPVLKSPPLAMDALVEKVKAQEFI